MCFAERGVKAIIIGGHAVAFHAKPRFTKDIDLWVEPSAENAERVLAALHDFGFGSVGLTLQDFAQPHRILQLGVPPNRIDIVTSIDGVDFGTAWCGRAEGKFGDQPAYFLGKAELIRNKRAARRPQDLADLDALGALDES